MCVEGVNLVDPGCYLFCGLFLTMFSCRRHIMAQVNTLVMIIAIAADQNTSLPKDSKWHYVELLHLWFSCRLKRSDAPNACSISSWDCQRSNYRASSSFPFPDPRWSGKEEGYLSCPGAAFYERHHGSSLPSSRKDHHCQKLSTWLWDRGEMIISVSLYVCIQCLHDFLIVFFILYVPFVLCMSYRW